MGGGIIQIVAKGQEDLYLSDEPHISYFKIIYRRHTNFTRVPIETTFNSSKDKFGSQLRTKIEKFADLVNQLYLIIDIPKLQLSYKKITKIEMKDLLTQYSITYDYIGDDNDIITDKDYVIVIEPLILNRLNDLNTSLTQYLDWFNDLVIINNDNSITNGLELALQFFKYEIGGDTYDPLIQFIIANILDNNNINKVYNWDIILNLLYQKLLSISTLGLFTNGTNLLEKSSIYQYLYQNIIFYHILEFGNYEINSSYIGNTTQSLFLRNLENGLESGTLQNYYNYDNIILFNQFFNTTSNPIINSYSDVSKVYTNLLDNLNWNLRKNIIQFQNITTFFRNMNYANPLKYRIGFYKPFSFITNDVYDGTTFINTITDANNSSLSDYFSSIISVQKLTGEPTNITHNFGHYINDNIQGFLNTIRDFYRETEYIDFFADYNIWKRLKMSDYYPSYSGIDNVVVIDLITRIIVDDIPDMVNKYILADPELSLYSIYFDLKTTQFYNDLKTEIDEYFSSYNLGQATDLRNYLINADASLRKTNDKLLISLFTSVKLFNIDMSIYRASNQDTGIDTLYPFFIDENLPNFSYYHPILHPLLYVIYKYELEYQRLIFELNTSTAIKNNLINLIIINCVMRFRTATTDFPSYTAYQANGYTLYNIENNIVVSNVTEPEFMDIASSILFNIVNSSIAQFNRLFGEKILTSTYIANNVGINAVECYNNFFNTIAYSPSLSHMTAGGPVSDILTSIPFTSYYYFNNVPSGDYDSILAYLTDMYNTYSTMFYQYNLYSNLLNIKNYATTRSANYFKDYMGDTGIAKILYDEMTNNQSKYYPPDIYGSGAFISVGGYAEIVSNTEEIINKALYGDNTDPDNIIIGVKDLLIQSYNPYSAIGSVNNLKQILLINISSISNPNNINSNLYEWYNNYAPYDKTIYLDMWNDIINNNIDATTIINDFNNTKMYSDPSLKAVYNNLSNYNNILDYVLHVAIQFTKLSIFSYNIRLDKQTTYDNFYNIINMFINGVITELNKIAIEENNVWQYSGSDLEKLMLNYINTSEPLVKWVKELGHYLLEKVELSIDGQIIHMFDSEILHNEFCLFYQEEKRRGYNTMIGNLPEYYEENISQNIHLVIPLPLWFCRGAEHALPLVALRHAEIELSVKLRDLDSLVQVPDGTIFNRQPRIRTKLLGEYIYVEKEERMKLAEDRHQILIETYEKSTEMIFDNFLTNTISPKLYFNNVSKYMVMQIEFRNNNNNFDWTLGKSIINNKYYEPIINMKLKFNGKDRQMILDRKYYNLLEPYYSGLSKLDDTCYLYSYSLNMKHDQPSGSANFSKIEDIIVEIKLDENILEYLRNNNYKMYFKAYSKNYNWLRIASGLAGLAFF
jgi:hypothetical protein